MVGAVLTIFIVLCIIGVVLWGIGKIPGLPPVVLTVAYVIIAIIGLLWLLSMVQGGAFNTGHIFGPH